MAGTRDSRGRFVGKGGDGYEANTSGWDTLKRTLETLRSGGSYVKAGVIGEKAAEGRGRAEYAGGSGMTNATLAAIHEFGAKGPNGEIPARPFILGTFEINRAKYLGLLKTKILPAIFSGKITPEQGLKILGELMASDIRNRMVEGEGIPPPLSPRTLAAKTAKGAWNKNGKAARESPRPLVDTGRLRNSISYAVVIQDEDAPSGGK